MALPIRKNVVKADLCNYSILLNGIGGVGKTTLFYQVQQNFMEKMED